MILGYEGNKAISISGLVVGVIFLILAVYTYFFTYIKKDSQGYLLKLPYRAAVKVDAPILDKQWRNFKIYKLNNDFQNYSVLMFSRKKN